ncbi:MAG: hypothetical protein FD161_2985 [Limisphaerales bacterium]|nr:MAG: hypothetical protein FD161_2985 [Limisphaerales bacterium]KAG0508098.1 MAG: hypothetical protein E1N63_2692 [Limisphaerales bacterium]TXT53049.1 MAG: hypothetical protein FD140_157 [Limisphaerales bacterium]
MKTKILLTLAMCAAALDARKHRQTNTLALGNAADVAANTELETLRKENAELKAAKESASADESLIRQKMNAGLTRVQAVKVVATAKKFAASAKELFSTRRRNAEAAAKKN